MTAAVRHLAALGVGAVLMVTPGCGSSEESKGDPLPADAVAAISGRLTEVQRRYDSATKNDNPGACRDIERDSYRAISATVKDLPSSVDADVRNALEESLARLQELTSEGCSQVRETPPQQDTTPQETVPPETVPQETTTEPTDTQTVPDEKKPKKDKGKGNGKGNGNGNGGTVTQPGGTVTQPGASGGAGEPGSQGDG